MNKLDIRIQLSRHADRLGDVLLQRLMVASVHHQKLIGCCEFSRVRQLFVPVNLCLCLVHRNLHTVVVPVCKQDARQLRSVRGCPHHLRIRRLILSAGHLVVRSDRFYTASKNNRVHAGLF